MSGEEIKKKNEKRTIHININPLIVYIMLLIMIVLCSFSAYKVMTHIDMFENASPLNYGLKKWGFQDCYCTTEEGESAYVTPGKIVIEKRAGTSFMNSEEMTGMLKEYEETLKNVTG